MEQCEPLLKVKKRFNVKVE